jgi:hypothetical protein
MKTKIILVLSFLIIGNFAQSQVKKSTLIKVRTQTFQDINYNSFAPGISQFNGELRSCQFDKEQLHTIIRQSISEKNLNKMSRNGWVITTKTSSLG